MWPVAKNIGPKEIPVRIATIWTAVIGFAIPVFRPLKSLYAPLRIRLSRGDGD
jgi:hypothetical protein